jgi:hypothetical protein
LPHPLDGLRFKLGRAQRQVDDLEAEVARFLRRDTYEIAQNFDPETGRVTLRFVVKHHPPAEWSVQIGEIVHNLRSALDHLACQLFLAGGGTDCDHTQFPILTDSSDEGFRKWMEDRLPGLPEPMFTQLREVQPYHAGDEARKDGLAILNRLSNQDKHRLLVPVFAAVVPGSTGMVGYREMRDVDASPQAEFFLPQGPLSEHAPLAELDFPITGPNPYVEVEPHFPIDIAFSDGGPIVTILQLIGHHVSTAVFRRFLDFFPMPLPEMKFPEGIPPPRRPF